MACENWCCRTLCWRSRGYCRGEGGREERRGELAAHIAQGERDGWKVRERKKERDRERKRGLQCKGNEKTTKKERNRSR